MTRFTRALKITAGDFEFYDPGFAWFIPHQEFHGINLQKLSV